MNRAVTPLMALLAILVVSGCISVTPEDIIKTSPAVSQFLKDYPDAEIKMTRYSSSEFDLIKDELKEDCDKTSVEAKNYYKVRITDDDSGLSMTAWIDWDSQMIECAVKEGEKREENDGDCISHSESKCYNGHVYWYNSCGDREDKKESCENGCENNQCKVIEDEECTEKYEEKCYENHVYWFDSCGKVGEKKEFCENGCENAKCLAAEVEETCESHKDTVCVEKSDVYTQICDDGVCVNKVHSYSYWVDSCGNKEEIKEVCYTLGCENGECVCSDESNSICDESCNIDNDIDCCIEQGKFFLEDGNGNTWCSDTDYNEGCSGGEECDGVSLTSKSDGCCPKLCSVDVDIDCCEEAGKYWLEGANQYYCRDTDYSEGCSGGEECYVSDGCCAVGCSEWVDPDCCEEAGKYWLEHPTDGPTCYNYNHTGDSTGEDECSEVSDGCCLVWCSTNNDIDCCEELDNYCWLESYGCYECS